MAGTGHFGHYGPGKLALAEQGKVDRRALRTRQALHEALIGLILERGYDEITVADIADAANVGRSTFYAHFVDKDALLRVGVDSMRSVLLAEHRREAVSSDPPERRALGFSRFMTSHLQEQLPLYRAMMRGRAGPIVLERLRSYLVEIVRTELKDTLGRPVPEVAVQFVVGAHMSVLVWWLDRGAKEPAADIDRAFRTLAEGALMAMPPASL